MEEQEGEGGAVAPPEAFAEPKPLAPGITYECVSCGSKLTAEQLAITPEIKCPFCGYRIIRKTRPPIVKQVKAR